MKRINKATGPDSEAALYARIRELILAARRSVSRGVDLVQVRTNFEIGRHIVEYEQKGKSRAAYGKEILNTLASRLASEFGPGFPAVISRICAAFTRVVRKERGLSRQCLDNYRTEPVHFP